jgi:hypothetical protein
LYRKDLVLKAVYLMDSGKDVELKIHVLQVIHFTVNCFHQCGCGCELCTEDDSKEKMVPFLSTDFIQMLRMRSSFLRYLW